MCWKAFLNVNEDIVREMAKLSTTVTPSDETMKAIEKFVCELYVPKTSLSTVKDLRWWLFHNKQAQSEGQSRDSYYRISAVNCLQDCPISISHELD